MTQVHELERPLFAQPVDAIPAPVLVVFRGIGQVFFQENTLTGVLFTLGIALSSPLMAAGLVVGAAIGTAVAVSGLIRLLRAYAKVRSSTS